MNSSAARTNLTSNSVQIHTNQVLGRGQFRTAYAGTYVGGNRNQQEAVCKAFRPEYRELEREFFATDSQVNEKAIELAEQWNEMCPSGKEILITYGSVHRLGGKGYLVEPLIRYFEKFTSNNGWIASMDDVGWAVLAMEAFSHFTYHRTGGLLIVCDLQGRYRHDRYNQSKCRFELTDVAICSRRRSYGVTDLGEKGIESFFANHYCNKFCNVDGNTWQSPRVQRKWFQASSGTSMICSSAAHLLDTRNRARFTSTLQPVYDEEDSDNDS